MDKNDSLPASNPYQGFDLDKILGRQPFLAKQNPETINSEITPLTFEIMSRQATINVGTIGHVAHGKTTLVKAVSGIHTIRSKIEKERNITYNLGYANAKLYKCLNCPRPECYRSFGSEKEDNPICDKCNGKLVLQRHISFVDCPGHDMLMATMLNGAAVMDAAMLLVAANEPCPQPQTSEHLAAVEIMNLNHIIILQNKIDIVIRDNSGKEQNEHIRKFVQGSKAQNSPIIPISAQFRHNIDVVIEYLCKIPVPVRDYKSNPKFIVLRSFDVNYPGEEVANLRGGVAGGTLVRGVLRLGEVVEIRPGIVNKTSDNSFDVIPIFTKIVSLQAEKNDLIYAIPGGLIGVGLTIDPYLTRGDRLVGKVSVFISRSSDYKENYQIFALKSK